MHPDIERRRQPIADRLRALPTDAQPPYDWLEFQRRTQVARLLMSVVSRDSLTLRVPPCCCFSQLEASL